MAQKAEVYLFLANKLFFCLGHSTYSIYTGDVYLPFTPIDVARTPKFHGCDLWEPCSRPGPSPTSWILDRSLFVGQATTFQVLVCPQHGTAVLRE